MSRGFLPGATVIFWSVGKKMASRHQVAYSITPSGNTVFCILSRAPSMACTHGTPPWLEVRVHPSRITSVRWPWVSTARHRPASSGTPSITQSVTVTPLTPSMWGL